MKKIFLSIVILLHTVFTLLAQRKSNFVMQLAGFDQYEKAAVTIQRLDEDADVLKLETELTDGHVFSVIDGKGKIELANLPKHFILTVNMYKQGSRNEFIDNWYVSATDSVVVTNNHSIRNFDKITFSGFGAERYRLQYTLDGMLWNRVSYFRYPSSIDYFTGDFAQLTIFDRAVDMNIEAGRLVNKSDLDFPAKEWMLANMFYKIYYTFLLRPLTVSFIKNDSKRTEDIAGILHKFESSYGATIVEKGKLSSSNYIDFYLAYWSLKNTLFGQNNINYRIKLLEDYFQDQSLENMGYAALKRSFYGLDEESRKVFLDWLIAHSKSSIRLEKLKLREAVAVGKPFPDFELTDLNGKVWHKKDLLGKVVFFDFYYTGCSNCAIYFKNTVSKVEEHFSQNPNVLFISVSIDREKELWKKSIESKKYNSDHSIKLYTNGLRDHHPLIEYLNIKGYPFPILMGKTGLIETSDNVKLGRSGKKVETLIETIDQAVLR
ncbi:TlpA family protein disulfide reductase [Sphingobacterium multivorum]|uniref:Thiol-disulfide oxidoreductase n=1 Tax=Sphingobacterium multivorum TaxID=28454 RepID=A0A654DJ56_SPHMU|nr:redoxin domain-containing protein [Sphingobacterium multivorum]QQT45469.1 redoxin domain-containing protein [Sphingobacterium multivorum]SUJ26228.1 thiol-disulfide oxidoreductase [Sphingobacterium multivorum]VXD04478.1 Thiol-disulfide oxidoreductase [Sphingobacterium multivorum]